MPGLNEALEPSALSVTVISVYLGRSSVEKLYRHLVHCRLLHMLGSFFDGRELVTCVDVCEQFIQNMYIY